MYDNAREISTDGSMKGAGGLCLLLLFYCCEGVVRVPASGTLCGYRWGVRAGEIVTNCCHQWSPMGLTVPCCRFVGTFELNVVLEAPGHRYLEP